jgi:hypothetical protein
MGYLGIKASASDNLNHVFSTGPSNSYVCNITGNFGIGTDSPDAKLDVESTVDYQIMAKYNATNYTEYGYYGLNVVGGGNPYLFKLQGTERMRITSSGDIWQLNGAATAGTYAPWAVSNPDAGIAINVPGASSRYLSFIDSATPGYGGGMRYFETSNYTEIYSKLPGAYTTHLRADRGAYHTWLNPEGTGNVGIGLATTPGSKLHVQSAGSTDVVFKLDNTNVADTAGAQIQLICDSAGSGDGNGALRHSIRSEFSGAINWEIHSGASHGDLNFSCLDSFAMIINSELDVGIGTDSPNEKLQVAGNAIIGTSSNYTSQAGSLSVNHTSGFNGGIVDTHSNGSARYYTRVAHASTGSGSAGYWHIKTNINVNASIMFLAKFYGYVYGQSAVVDLQHTGYAYTGGSVIAQGTTNNSSVGGMSSAIYLTAANEVCFRIDLGGSTYYAGLWMDIGFQNPTGGNLNFKVEAQVFSATANYYT